LTSRVSSGCGPLPQEGEFRARLILVRRGCVTESLFRGRARRLAFRGSILVAPGFYATLTRLMGGVPKTRRPYTSADWEGSQQLSGSCSLTATSARSVRPSAEDFPLRALEAVARRKGTGGVVQCSTPEAIVEIDITAVRRVAGSLPGASPTTAFAFGWPRGEAGSLQPNSIVPASWELVGAAWFFPTLAGGRGLLLGAEVGLDPQ